MDLEITQNTTTAKFSILKQGEYDMWRLRIEQHFQVQDYALWDIIENGNPFIPAIQTTTNADGTSTTLIPGPDVKTLFAARQKRFGGNEATKKTRKTLLKQMCENFITPSTYSLDFIFNRLQKNVCRLAIMGENISQEDLNLKFLRSLPSKWDTHSYIADDEVPTNMALMKFSDLRKGAGFVSYNDVPPPSTRLFSPPKLDLSNSGLHEFQQPEFEGYGPKASNGVSEDISNKVKESPDALLLKEPVADDKVEKRTVFPTIAKI
nr:ribonuclease H-like domain-containing protein [Tanacetum cinerariifolium]